MNSEDDMVEEEASASTDSNRPLRPRGSQPVSKPQPTRRQERNRLAQQALRERRSQYLNHLEKSFQTSQEENEKLTATNTVLQSDLIECQTIMLAHGLKVPSRHEGAFSNPAPATHTPPNPQPLYPGSGSTETSNNFTVNPKSLTYSPTNFSNPMPARSKSPTKPITLSSQFLDYELISTNFILALERICLDHIQPQRLRGLQAQNTPHGHALLASLPSEALISSFPESDYYEPEPTQIKSTLHRLLELSSHLNLKGESLTPVMAWRILESHPRFPELREADFKTISTTLVEQVRCHHFGAVMEQHMFSAAVHDCLAGRKSDS